MNKDSLAAFTTKLQGCPLGELYFITLEYLTPYLIYIGKHKWLFRTMMEKPTVLSIDKSYSVRRGSFFLQPSFNKKGNKKDLGERWRGAFGCDREDSNLWSSGAENYDRTVVLGVKTWVLPAPYSCAQHKKKPIVGCHNRLFRLFAKQQCSSGQRVAHTQNRKQNEFHIKSSNKIQNSQKCAKAYCFGIYLSYNDNIL